MSESELDLDLETELEESTNKNRLERIELTREQSKALNAILSSKDLSNEVKYEAMRQFRGTCHVCKQVSYYILTETKTNTKYKICDKCLEQGEANGTLRFD